jgi:hypothetical protein
MFCVPAGGVNLRPCRSRRRQCDAGAGERQRRTDSARTRCSVPLSRGELAIDRQHIVGREDVPPSDCRARRMFTPRRRAAEGATVFLQVRTRRRREKPPGWRSRRPPGHRQPGKLAAPSLSGHAPTRRRCWPASARRPPPSWPRSAPACGHAPSVPGARPAPSARGLARLRASTGHDSGNAKAAGRTPRPREGTQRNPAGLTRRRPR